MTGRIGPLPTQTQMPTLSDADAARIAAEEALHAQWQRQAAWVIAASARDATDCRLLLNALGLDADIVRAAREEHRVHGARRATSRRAASATRRRGGKRSGLKPRAA
jgi:hypothetical protein